jgi:hypothetical protein
VSDGRLADLEEVAHDLNEAVEVVVGPVGRALQVELPVSHALPREGWVRLLQLAVVVREGRQLCIGTNIERDEDIAFLSHTNRDILSCRSV